MEKKRKDSICVLISGGFDSAVMCDYLLRRYHIIHPLFIACGLRWERAELYWVRRFLTAMRHRYGNRICRLTVIRTNIDVAYGKHWSINENGTPGKETSDDTVYLPGRNLILLTHAAIFCERRGICDVAIGHLASNPFPDARAIFFRTFERVVWLATRKRIYVVRPFARLSKLEVIRHAAQVPIHLTFSCLDPRGVSPCGECNKCAEYTRLMKKIAPLRLKGVKK